MGPLFQYFLVNSDEYEAAEQFWNSMFEETIQSAGQAGTWRSWRPRHYVNGTPFERDGNPIFDALSTQLGRAVQVVQWPPEGDGIAITAWLSELTAPDEHDHDQTVLELTINLSLSEDSAAIARTLMSNWVDPSVTRFEMNQRIARIASTE